MSKTQESIYGMMGCCLFLIAMIAFGTLLGLKLTETIAVSWVVVFLPLIVYFGLALVLLAVACLICIVGIGLTARQIQKERKRHSEWRKETFGR